MKFLQDSPQARMLELVRYRWTYAMGGEAWRTLKRVKRSLEVLARKSSMKGGYTVVISGFYEFTRMQDGKFVSSPARYTMLLRKRKENGVLRTTIRRPTSCQDNKSYLQDCKIVGLGGSQHMFGFRPLLARSEDDAR